MENIKSVTSEEELLHLRNEGKISEADYKDLLTAMKKPPKVGPGPVVESEPKPTRTSGLAIASLVLSIISLIFGPLGCIPGIICGHLALGKMKKEPALQGRGLAQAGLIIGYIFIAIFIVILTIAYEVPRRIHTLDRAKEEIRLARQQAQQADMEAIIPDRQIHSTELKRFPLDDTEGLLTQSSVRIDEQITSDGNGSLRIEAAKPMTIRLFEVGDIDIENARLIYQAKVRTENLDGQAYLEMWCHFSGRGEFFSRGLMAPLTGTIEWTTQETPFFLKAGENPDNVKLNLVINGKGTVWIDDIRLSAFK
jgi:hypothetical protein